MAAAHTTVGRLLGHIAVHSGVDCIAAEDNLHILMIVVVRVVADPELGTQKHHSPGPADMAPDTQELDILAVDLALGNQEPDSLVIDILRLEKLVRGTQVPDILALVA